MMGGMNPGSFNQANSAALFQQQAQSMRTQQIAAGVLNGDLNADEFAALATRNLGRGFGRPAPVDPSLGGDQAQAQAIFNQVKADSEGFQRLNNRYSDGDYHPKPKAGQRQQFRRTRALFEQLKSGQINPFELQQKLQQAMGR